MATTAPPPQFTDNTAPDIEKSFRAATAKHQMTVLRDDGVYRHVRFSAPNTSFYRFDLVTWPGHLAITGDMGSYVFARLKDMFAFFRGTDINPHYWAEKVVAGSGAKSYSEERFRQYVTESIADYADEHPALTAAVQKQIFDSSDWDTEHGARELLDCFEYEGFRFDDAWEWDLRDFTFLLLQCCHAIRWGIEQYDTARRAASAQAEDAISAWLPNGWRSANTG